MVGVGEVGARFGWQVPSVASLWRKVSAVLKMAWDFRMVSRKPESGALGARWRFGFGPVVGGGRVAAWVWTVGWVSEDGRHFL